MKVYSPSEGDECYVGYDGDGDGVSIDPTDGCQVDEETVAWWHMSDGRVLGVYDGRLIEYEPSTLAPLGLVVGYDELQGKKVVVVGSGVPDECVASTASVSQAVGMEGADCAEFEGEEQAVLLVDEETGGITVVQPNEDGSYWRKIVRNKMHRMREQRRVKAAAKWFKDKYGDDKDPEVLSSWGPYTSTVGQVYRKNDLALPAISTRALDSSIPK
uniref:Uncharacterized protein n=2 Tax=Emiliania huxleyi TaxID=2903 RepID=A0A7S3T8V1_EMIHU